MLVLVLGMEVVFGIIKERGLFLRLSRTWEYDRGQDYGANK